MFLTAAILVSAALGVAVPRFVMRGHSPQKHRRAVLSVAVLTALFTALALLVPLGDPRLAEPAVAGTEYWPLSTGSRLAYVHLPAGGDKRSDPVVLLHGGPGIPDLPGLTELGRPLTELGFDVYVYDQLGAGRSSRLAEPGGYGLDRDTVDLEQVRRTIGAERMILVGHSYGGTLAAHYLAAHPDRVTRMILISPGPLDPADNSGSAATTRVPLEARAATYALALQPRALLEYALLQVDPAAAHSYLGDAEADARNDTLLQVAEPGLFCSEPHLPPASSGSGFSALQYPQSAAAPDRSDIRPQLAGNATPVLVLKGRCDYLSWAAAAGYQQSTVDVTLLYVRNAGHNIHQEQPALVRDAIGAFLTGGGLPLPAFVGLQQPPDYQQ